MSLNQATESVREFVYQIEKALAARRLYRLGSEPWIEANTKLLEKCRAAALAEPFTIEFSATDLFFEKVSVLNRPKREDSFFFPLFRDGLREMTFAPDVTQDDLNALLDVFELRERDLGNTDDLVAMLWRSDLSTITHTAIDGIGDVEDDGSGDATDDFRSVVADLADKIKQPAIPDTAQKYSFQLDADVRVAAQDFHYDHTTVRRTFEENPTVLRLTEEQAAALRAELGSDRDSALVERFIEILLIIVRSPMPSAGATMIGPIFLQLAEGYWAARDFGRVAAILSHVRAAANEAPRPENRAAMAEVVKTFFSGDRITASVLDFTSGSIPPPIALRLWDIVPDTQIWPALLDSFARLPEGESRQAVVAALRRRLAANPELLAQTLTSPDPAHVRAGLAVLDERTERVFARQLVALAGHPDESIRIKGLAVAVKLGGENALEILWKAMESDPAKSVRLYAFRSIASSTDLPGLLPRLQTLVTTPQFAERPVWEREKYIRLLGNVGGASVEPLFESWIPSKRWIWQAKDLEILELALRGLGACGERGYEKVLRISESGGKPAEVARKVLDSISRCEVGENTVMRPRPTVESDNAP